jgi:predicted PurR-regulated permease PerM
LRQIVRYTLVILAAIAAALLLYEFRGVMLILVISLALTAATRPLLKALAKIRLPGFFSQLLILLGLLVFVGALVYATAPNFLGELQRLSNYALIQYASVFRVWEAGPAWQQSLISRLPDPGGLADSVLGENGALLLPTAINLTQGLMEFFGSLFILLTFSLYWAEDQNHFERLWLSLLPPYRRVPVRNAWRAVEQAIGRYLRQELVLALTAALLLGAGYALLGLPYPSALALLAFFGWFIPLLGFAVILIPVFLSALGLGWGYVLLAVIYTLLVLLGLKYWLVPKYLQSRRYSNFLIVFWIVVLGSFLGLVGFFAAPVVAVASQVIWEQYLELRTGQRSRPEQVEIKIGSLQKRHAAAFEHYLEIKEKYPSPELNSIFERLERFLRHTQQLAEEDFADG